MSNGFSPLLPGILGLYNYVDICSQDLPLTSHIDMLLPIDMIIESNIHILRCLSVFSVMYPHFVVKKMFNIWYSFADSGQTCLNRPCMCAPRFVSKVRIDVWDNILLYIYNMYICIFLVFIPIWLSDILWLPRMDLSENMVFRVPLIHWFCKSSTPRKEMLKKRNVTVNLPP